MAHISFGERTNSFMGYTYESGGQLTKCQLGLHVSLDHRLALQHENAPHELVKISYIADLDSQSFEM